MTITPALIALLKQAKTLAAERKTNWQSGEPASESLEIQHLAQREKLIENISLFSCGCEENPSPCA